MKQIMEFILHSVEYGVEKKLCLLVKCMSSVFTYSSLEHVKLLALNNFMNTKHF